MTCSERVTNTTFLLSRWQPEEASYDYHFQAAGHPQGCLFCEPKAIPRGTGATGQWDRTGGPCGASVVPEQKSQRQASV